MQRILVTGATGFVGRHLLPFLFAAFPDAWIVPADFNMRDGSAIAAAVREVKPEACIHLAAISGVPAAKADPEAAWQVNLHGTLSLAHALLREAPGCTLLHVSTAEVYGSRFRDGVPAREDTGFAPMNTYAATKAAADLALGALVGDGLRLIRMRPFNHIGPGQSSGFVVASFARQVARIAAGLQAPVLQVGALEPQRDFLDVRDVCRAYVLCLTKAEQIPPGAIFNIASGMPRRVGDVLAALLSLAGVQAEVRTEAARLRRSEIMLACGDASAARAMLGWLPDIPWSTTLTDILADWQQRVLQPGA